MKRNLDKITVGEYEELFKKRGTTVIIEDGKAVKMCAPSICFSLEDNYDHKQ